MRLLAWILLKVILCQNYFYHQIVKFGEENRNNTDLKKAAEDRSVWRTIRRNCHKPDSQVDNWMMILNYGRAITSGWFSVRWFWPWTLTLTSEMLTVKVSTNAENLRQMQWKNHAKSTSHALPKTVDNLNLYRAIASGRFWPWALKVKSDLWLRCWTSVPNFTKIGLPLIEKLLWLPH